MYEIRNTKYGILYFPLTSEPTVGKQELARVRLWASNINITCVRPLQASDSVNRTLLQRRCAATPLGKWAVTGCFSRMRPSKGYSLGKPAAPRRGASDRACAGAADPRNRWAGRASPPPDAPGCSPPGGPVPAGGNVPQPQTQTGGAGPTTADTKGTSLTGQRSRYN